MELKRSLIVAVVLSTAAAGAHAQDMFQMPKPGPEHEILKQEVGTWDATVEMLMPPAPPSKGVETNTLGPGGMWVINDFKSEMMGAPFQGHGIVGWDPAKKKYVGTWVDSMSTSLSITESTHDPATRTMNGYINTVGPDGAPMKLKAVTQMKDDDTRVFTLYMPGPDGKEAPSMRITYKRRK